MKTGYRWALVFLAIGLLPMAIALVARTSPSLGGLLVAAVAIPITILLAIRTRVGLRISIRAALGGGLLGPLIALVSQPLVALFAAVFVAGFGDSGRKLLEALQASPELTTALGSPWVILLLAEIALVVPFVEEFAKALGASFARPASRQQAFLAGVTAGCAFAATEDILYVVGGAIGGTPWTAMVAIRMLGSAVHPLATGVTMLGYWEWRHRQDTGAFARHYLAAAGIHALWNGSTTVAAVALGAFVSTGSSEEYGVVALCYDAVLSILLGAALWQVTRTVCERGIAVLRWRLNTGQALAGWTLLGATLLVPATILLLAFPRFYLG